MPLGNYSLKELKASIWSRVDSRVGALADRLLALGVLAPLTLHVDPIETLLTPLTLLNPLSGAPEFEPGAADVMGRVRKL
jgi:hypothetical protein